MSYKYNKRNLINEPERYMYTEFMGVDFFKYYFESRYKFIASLNEEGGNIFSLFETKKIIKKVEKNLAGRSLKEVKIYKMELNWFYERYEKRVDEQGDKKTNAESLINKFSFDKELDTEGLFIALLSSLLSNQNAKEIKIWTKHMLQRFEVTKKFYNFYLPGGKKGYGATDSIETYCYFALILSMLYSEKFKLQYLNTLIKLCDLITSIPPKKIVNNFSVQLVRSIVSIELVFVKILLDSKGIVYDPAS
ncbi:MAG: hypothetical protein CMG57_08695 [Candidatus Marinimicrobia bacterium]|nr:hypothetical protein [Candidatus Neomarinimicrobiota bacterium]|tara:strand:+ start:4826 stop:5572 length:747 start_codon:yes stop_codon:yes gene_type:complete